MVKIEALHRPGLVTYAPLAAAVQAIKDTYPDPKFRRANSLLEPLEMYVYCGDSKLLKLTQLLENPLETTPIAQSV